MVNFLSLKTDCADLSLYMQLVDFVWQISH
jgi:hypothetical protein